MLTKNDYERINVYLNLLILAKTDLLTKEEETELIKLSNMCYDEAYF
jgi:hypothetical protein